MGEKDFLPILKTSIENINKKAVVCGDPERAEKIAAHLSEAEEISYNREYRLFNGFYNEQKISVICLFSGIQFCRTWRAYDCLLG